MGVNVKYFLTINSILLICQSVLSEHALCAAEPLLSLNIRTMDSVYLSSAFSG